MKHPLSWIVYTLTNPRTGEVRYVGWTCKTLNRRLNTHIQTAVSKPPRDHRAKWILSLLSIGVRPVIEAIESGSGEGWAEAEKRWIATFRANGARLVNATDGGEGTVGCPSSAAARKASSLRTKGKRMDAEHLAKWHAAARAANLGRALSKEHRAKLSKIQIGKKRPLEVLKPMWEANVVRYQNGISDETREKQAAVKRGKVYSAETRAKMSAAALGKPDSPEVRAKKGAIIRMRFALLTPEQRHEQMSAIAKRKGWETRALAATLVIDAQKGGR